MPLAPGTRLGPYEILAPIGSGGMGTVYKARDARLGRNVYAVGSNLDLLRAPIGSNGFAPVSRFGAAAAPTARGTAIAVPNDESYIIYRVVTRNVSTLVLVDGLR